jgi:aerobic-type carbon monoxide dehydrogenase small subunit (CoxS/CutS family)
MKVELVLNGRAAALEARSDEMLLAALRREGLL